MAARSFLLDSDLETARQILNRGAVFPSQIAHARQNFSRWLETRLRARLDSVGDFMQAGPVLVGSWARGELCPKSDIDLVLTGPAEFIAPFTASAMALGLKIRARTPLDPNDWSVGVEPFDVLALMNGIGLTAEATLALAEQQKRIPRHRRAIFNAIKTERATRRQRQDSITNYLEPNLKFGAGGLRDIEQALSLRNMFSAKFAAVESYPFEVLSAIKEELLFLRANLHLLGSGDILTAADQLELTQLLGLKDSHALMTHVQSELERASFYADWVVALASRAPKDFKPTTLSQVIRGLKADSSLPRQYLVRRNLKAYFAPLKSVAIGRALHRAIAGPVSDGFLVALYRTRLLEMFLPDLKKLRGLVQHDHYHRYTADAHVLQALRGVQRAEDQARTLGPLRTLHAKATRADWWTLKLTALFHDLAKGQGGGHAELGAALATRYLKAWQYPARITGDVAWLVKNHLVLSTAAFRQNPQSPGTWRRLFERGVSGRRLTLLTLFTAIDIQATNPDAWTEWKAKLLLALHENLRSPSALDLNTHLQRVRRLPDAAELSAALLELDPELLASLSPKLLRDDLRAARAGDKDLPPKILRTRQGTLWVRFHQREDRPGVFLNFVRCLFGFGLNIQMASVNTPDGIGAYDWFCLRTKKDVRQISRWLGLAPVEIKELPEVGWQSIDLMSQDVKEWVFSFRGRDQRGLLLNAAGLLGEINLSIRWARAHTWGQQVDDIFSVVPAGDAQTVLANLRDRAQLTDQIS